MLTNLNFDIEKIDNLKNIFQNMKLKLSAPVKNYQDEKHFIIIFFM